MRGDVKLILYTNLMSTLLRRIWGHPSDKKMVHCDSPEEHKVTREIAKKIVDDARKHRMTIDENVKSEDT